MHDAASKNDKCYKTTIHLIAQRIVYDSSLILGFTTGRILLVSEGQLSKAGGFAVVCHWHVYTRCGRGPSKGCAPSSPSGLAAMAAANGIQSRRRLVADAWGVKGNRRGGADHGGGCWGLVFSLWRGSGGL